MNVPEGLYYTKEHEWIRVEGDEAVVGISAYAADQLGDVVFVELPGTDAALAADEPFGVVESVKSVSDLYAPLDGTIIAVNEELEDAPELVNESPYDKGWMMRMKMSDPAAAGALLNAEAYKALITE